MSGDGVSITTAVLESWVMEVLLQLPPVSGACGLAVVEIDHEGEVRNQYEKVVRFIRLSN